MLTVVVRFFLPLCLGLPFCYVPGLVFFLMPLLLAFGAQLALGDTCSYESGVALPRCDTKGAMLPSLPPWVLVMVTGCFSPIGGVHVAYVAVALVRAILRACMGGFVYDARARMLCLLLLSVGPSVGLGVCPFCFVLLCLMFLSLLWANATFVSACLLVLAYVMFLPTLLFVL